MQSILGRKPLAACRAGKGPPVTDHNIPDKNAERGGTADTAHTAAPKAEEAPNTELQDELESIRAIGENR
jgi:hypothetical protein